MGHDARLARVRRGRGGRVLLAITVFIGTTLFPLGAPHAPASPGAARAATAASVAATATPPALPGVPALPALPTPLPAMGEHVVQPFAAGMRPAGAELTEFQVQQGWNLFTMPLVPTLPLSASMVLATVLGATQSALVAMFSLRNNAWSPPLIQQAGHAPTGVDFPLTLGRAYLLYADQPGLVALSGSAPPPPLTWSLAAGWNLVGVPRGTPNPFLSDDALQGVLASSGGSVDAVFQLSAAHWAPSQIQVAGRSAIGDSFPLAGGAGYLLYSDRPATYTLPPAEPPSATGTATATAAGTPTVTPTATATATPPYVLPGGLVVSTGYADGDHTASYFPHPWAGDANVIFVGACAAPYNSCDTAAIRIDNHTATAAAIKDVSVAFPNPTYGLTVLDPWTTPTSFTPLSLPITLPPGKTLILATTDNYGDFDTSDRVPSLPGASCTTPLPAFYYPPVVTVTLGDGSKTSLYDTAHIVDDGGADTDCIFPWHALGTAGPNAQGTIVTLSPLSAARTLHTGATFVAHVTDLSGASPQQGVTVGFNVIGGPNAGLTGQAVTDDLGNATYVYSSTVTGLDTVVASVPQTGNYTTPITSNQGTVSWVTQLFGTLRISPLQVYIHRSSVQTFTVTAANAAGTPLSGAQVTLTISGHNARRLTTMADSAGVARFSYTNSGGPGTDTVQASAAIGGGAVTSNPVTVPWDALIEVNADGIAHGRILRFDGANGSAIDTPLATGAADLGIPLDAIVGADGNLYVSNTGGSGDPVLRFSGDTLAPLPAPGRYGSTFVAAGSSDMVGPTQIAFGPDGNLYVLNYTGNNAGYAVYRFSGTTGAPLPAPGQSGAVFVPRDPVTLNDPGGLAFGRDGNLYIVDRVILRYSGTTGAPLPAPGQSGAVFVPYGTGGGPGSGLYNPRYLTVGPDGQLYVSDAGNVLRFDGVTGASLPALGQPGAIFTRPSIYNGLFSVAFGPDGNLYTNQNDTEEVYRYDGALGTPLPAPGQSGAVFIADATSSAFNATSLAFTGPDVAPSFVPTSTPSPTNTATITATLTATRTSTRTSTATAVNTPTGTRSPSATPTASGTATPTRTPTRTGTATPTASATWTATATSTATINPDEIVTASIISPTVDEQVTGIVPITGTVGVSNGTLAHWDLAYAPLGSSAFTALAGGGTAVSNGRIGALDTTTMRDGQYALRLRVVAADGKTQTLSGLIVDVVGQLKIGNLQFTVTDLTVPLLGIPITINRTYDNFQHAQGDFGIDWQEATVSANAQEDTCLGDVTVQLPIASQPLTFTFDPRDTGGNLDGYELFAPAWDPDPATGAVLSDPNGASTALVTGVDPDNPQCWVDIFNNLNPYAPSPVRVTTTDNAVYTITANVPEGLTEVDEAGVAAKLTFSATGVKSNEGPAVTFTRDSQGRITTITDPAGKTIQYSYDANGDLSTMIDRDGGKTTYHYDANHDLLSETDPSGKTTAAAQYTASGQLTGITDANGHTTGFSVNLATHQQVITDPLGHRTTNVFDSYGDIVQRTDPLGNTTRYSYDPSSQLPVSITDPLGRTTRMTYDALGKLTQQTDPLGDTTTYRYDAQNHLLTQSLNGAMQAQLTYDSNGNPASLTDAAGNTTQISVAGNGIGWVSIAYANGAQQHTTTGNPGGTINAYSGPDDLNGTGYARDALGRITSSDTNVGGRHAITSYTYDAEGRVLTVTDPMGGVTTNAYDAAGRLTATTDPDGHTTRYSYDALGRLATTTYDDGSTTRQSYDAAGNLASTTDQNGKTTTYVYDADNRLIETDYPDGSTTLTGYDAAGEKISSTDGDGNTTTYAYDADGRLIKQTDPLGNSSTYTYDPLTGDETGVTDPAGHVTTYSYDSGHHRTGTSTTVTSGGVTVPISSTTTYTAMGLQASVTDPLGRRTSYSYTGGGNLSGVSDPAGDTASYGYDAVGNLTTLNNRYSAYLQPTVYTYDLNNRLISTTYPDRAVKTYSYDAAGNLTSVTDARQQTTAYSYDDMNRVSRVVYPDHTVTFTYYPGGQRKSMTDQYGTNAPRTTSYSIDSMGRVTSIAAPNGTLRYTYDGAGHRTSIATPSGTTSYQYDADGRPTRVTDPHGHSTSYTYDSRGNLSSRALPNGVTTTYGYDELSRLISLSSKKGSTLLWQDLYTLDAAGQRTSVQETDQHGAVTTYTYSYDADGRLLSEQQVRSSTVLVSTFFTYNAVGDRVTRVDHSGTSPATTSYTYDANGRGELVAQSGPGGATTTYTYDADGNMTGRTSGGVTTSYSYDSQNRLISVATGGITTATYRYDPDGTLISSTEAGVTTTYLVDPAGLDGLAQVVESTQTNGSSTSTTEYVYGNERIDMDRGTGGVSYYLYDGNMNTRLLVDGTGAVQNSYRYDAYGTLLAATGTVPNAFLYDGQQFDAGVGLYYLRARSMDPTLGRFLSEDPLSPTLRDPITLHRYLYAADNPVSYDDPSGQDFELTLAGLEMRISLEAGLFNASSAFRGAVAEGVASGLAASGNLLSAMAEIIQIAYTMDNLSVAGGAAILWGSGTAFSDNLAGGFFSKIGLGATGNAGKVLAGTLNLASNVQQVEDPSFSPGLLFQLIGYSGDAGAMPALGMNLAAFLILDDLYAQNWAIVKTLPLQGQYHDQAWQDYVVRFATIYAGIQLAGAASAYDGPASIALGTVSTIVALAGGIAATEALLDEYVVAEQARLDVT